MSHPWITMCGCDAIAQHNAVDAFTRAAGDPEDESERPRPKPAGPIYVVEPEPEPFDEPPDMPPKSKRCDDQRIKRQPSSGDERGSCASFLAMTFRLEHVSTWRQWLVLTITVCHRHESIRSRRHTAALYHRCFKWERPDPALDNAAYEGTHACRWPRSHYGANRHRRV